MAALKERLRAFLGLDTKDFERGLGRSQKQVKSFSDHAAQSLSGLMSKATGLGTAFMGGIAGGVVGAALAGVSSNLNGMVKSVAAVGDEARRAGMSLQAFQEWRYVAEQTRVGVDQIVDGFKELSMRADEFVTTGGGSAADAFQRLGYSAADLKAKLKDPSALMLEIVDRMKGLGAAARLRVADEIFGGALAEQFGQLMEHGSGGLRGLIAEAHSAGAVLDSELIAKAEELDRKFSNLTTTIANFGKRVAVALASAGLEATDFRERLDRIFPDEAQGRGIMGDALYDTLERDREALAAQANDLDRLKRAHERLARDARAVAHEMGVAAQELPRKGFDDQRLAIEQNVTEMRRLAEGIDSGTISAEEFQSGMEKAAGEAEAMFATMQNDEGLYFVNVTEALTGLMGRLGGAISLAIGLKGALQEAAGVDPVSKARQAELNRLAAEKASIASADALAEATAKFTASERERNSATSEALRLEREIEAVRKRAKDAGLTLTDAQARDAAGASLAGEAARQAAERAARGSGDKGGKSKLDDFAREAQAIRDRTQALQTEAAMLTSVAGSQRKYGDAMEFAYVKAELLASAQRAGHALTPELTAEIDKLAQAYVTAGLNAEEAAERLREVEESGERGANALSSIFTSVLDGSKSAKQAVADLLMEMAKVQMQRAFLGLADGGGGGILSAIGGLLGGKRATGGPVKAGVPYLVNENTPRSEYFVPSENGAVLTVAQAQAAMARASGGNASAPSLTGGGSGGTSVVQVRLSPELVGEILHKAERQSVQIAQASDRNLPARVQQILENPRRYG
ncbi:phage tail tape measure protein [Falsigemmobacter faecalis]|uniref:Phage tail tape measure protein domain-containing protein n=1 Tax=Falsigemmobacter faecalis TaxID=2488730 RepID=A0A3P3DA79_9RHOB|nr:phage tail tape measure protein [Falsigemmobacter faecalis]RRH71263.1 hypothetical protein EG244_16435 [Falsigemmobacter faecalis]